MHEFDFDVVTGPSTTVDPASTCPILPDSGAAHPHSPVNAAGRHDAVAADRKRTQRTDSRS